MQLLLPHQDCAAKPSCAAGEPSGELKSAIEKDFGSYDEFKKQFSTAGATQFGSGWAWLVSDGGKLKVQPSCIAASARIECQCVQSPTLNICNNTSGMRLGC